MESPNNARPQVIILSDMVGRNILFRYSAPYLLAHSLRSQGYKVKIIDWFTQPKDYSLGAIKRHSSSELKYVFFCSTFLMTAKEYSINKEKRVESFNERNLDMVSSTMWFSSKPEMIDWFSQLKTVLKKNSPDCKIAIGGGATARIMYYIPELAPYIDLIVSGYGEYAAVSLLKNESINTGEYNGYKYWKVPPDLQPLKAYPFVMSKEDHFQPEEAGILELARGCRFSCKFCSYDTGRAAHLSKEELRDILLKNYDTFGVKYYHFVDNCINDSIEKIRIIHEVSKQLPFDLEWGGYARPEMYSKHPEMIDLMAESGAGGLFYGIETLDKRAGMLCGKGGDKQKFMELMLGIQNKYKDQIYTMGSFIVGLPQESKESVLKSMDWVTREKPFHYSSFGSMVLQHPDFIKATKHLVFENNGYSKFSTSPERYGIGFTNRYKYIGEWKHEHMTFDEANQLSVAYTEKAIQNTLITKNSSFDYVAFRGVGFSREEILNCANNGSPEEIKFLSAKLEEKSIQAITKYHKQNY